MSSGKDIPMKRITTLIIVCCLWLLVAASPCFAKKDRSFYTVFDIPGSTYTQPTSINNGGDVAGSFCPTGDNCNSGLTGRGFVREFGGNITTFDGIPTSINDAGAVVGYLSDSSGQHCCFLRDQKGNVTVFDVPQLLPPDPSRGYVAAINNQGEVAGYIRPCMRIGAPCEDYPGFVRDRKGNITVFVIPKGLVAEDINARGDITGHTVEEFGGEQGVVRYRDGDITIFEVPGTGGPREHAHAVSINNGGDIAGYFLDDLGDRRYHGFIRDRDGTFTVFDVPSPTSIARMNEKGDIVGSGFLRDHKGNITLFDGEGVSINNRDDVTGILYEYQNGTILVHGFVRSAR
jgi:hypothetical protein